VGINFGATPIYFEKKEKCASTAAMLTTSGARGWGAEDVLAISFAPGTGYDAIHRAAFRRGSLGGRNFADLEMHRGGWPFSYRTGIRDNMMPPYGSQPAPAVPERQCCGLGLVGFGFTSCAERHGKMRNEEGSTKWRGRVCEQTLHRAMVLHGGPAHGARSASRHCRARKISRFV